MKLSDDDRKKLESAAAKVTPEDEASVRKRFSAALNTAVKRGADSKLIDGLKSLWGMLTDKDYVVSWESKALIVFALGYFISPLDMVPDAVPGAGWADDALVVVWALHNLEEELAAYRKAKGLDVA